MIAKLSGVVKNMDLRFQGSVKHIEDRLDGIELAERATLDFEKKKGSEKEAPKVKSDYTWTKSSSKITSVSSPKKVSRSKSVVPTPAPATPAPQDLPTPVPAPPAPQDVALEGPGGSTSGGGIAVILRGEAFRDWGLGNNGFRLVMNCGCQDALDAQQEIYKSHMQMKKWLLADGHPRVDFYGASYACSNGKDYADKLPKWYGDDLKEFKLLDYSKYSQWTMYQAALDVLPNQGKEYEHVLVLRWDYKIISKFHKCLFDAPIPMDARDATGEANYDIWELWSTKWFSTMRNSVNPDGTSGGVGKLKCHPFNAAEKALGWSRNGAPCASDQGSTGIVYDEDKCPQSVRSIQHYRLMTKWTAEQQQGQSHLAFTKGDGCNAVCKHVADEILKNSKSQKRHDAYCARVKGCCD
jgi:hypothetical protein